MPTSSAQQQEQDRGHDFSAYHTTSNRRSTSSTGSVSSQTIPSIFTPQDLNKPLPPSPPQSPANALRSFFRRNTTNHQNSSHLGPESHLQHQRHSFAEATLSVDTHDYLNNHTRSMPSSPFECRQSPVSPDSVPLALAHSAIPMFLETTDYQPYSLQPERRPSQSARSVSVHTFFDSPPRARTFPETTNSSSTARGRQRSYSCLSPTDPFTDPSQFHLFAEATTGIPESLGLFSSDSPPSLQSSLFTQTHNGRPTSFHSASESRTELSRDITDWQNFESQTFMSQSTPRLDSSTSRPERPQSQLSLHMNALNRELELLGLDDDTIPPDDELPDYAQSQAEHHAGKRIEALARARELEARWRDSRGRAS